MASLNRLKERPLSRAERDSETGCWNWTGSTTGRGYGQIWFGAKMLRAHRVSYEIHCGPITDGLYVCHRCDNPICINPSHLFLGTHADNVADMLAKGRQSRVRGEKNGHARLTEVDVLEIRAAVGVKQHQLAEKYGVAVRHIRDIRSGKRWTGVPNQCQPRRRLSDDEKIVIREIKGLSSRAIAEQFGVSHPTILAIRRL